MGTPPHGVKIPSQKSLLYGGHLLLTDTCHCGKPFGPTAHSWHRGNWTRATTHIQHALRLPRVLLHDWANTRHLLQESLEGLRVCRPESGCQTGIWCMRGEGHQGGHLCSALESNLRLTHSLPTGRRETRFRLLWICFAV